MFADSVRLSSLSNSAETKAMGLTLGRFPAGRRVAPSLVGPE